MPESITIGELISGVEAIDTDLIHIQRGVVDRSLPVAELLKQGPMGPRGLQGLPGVVTTVSVPGPAGPQGQRGERGPAGGPQGAQGAPGYGYGGATGLTGAAGAPGLASLNNRGTYSPAALYSLHDLVSWDGSSFIWMTVDQGNSQPSLLNGSVPPGSSWQLIAARGLQGPPNGPPGPLGPRGIQGYQGQPGPQFVAKGTWDNTVDPLTSTFTFLYHQYDLVNLNGSSYYWIQEYPGNSSPLDPVYWQLVAAKGDIGPSGGLQGDRGEQGLTGASVVGPRGLTGDVGPVGPPGAVYVTRGTYNPSTFYNEFDYIDYLGASYYCRASAGSQGNDPPNIGFWQLVSGPGIQGLRGFQGIQGDRGLPGPPPNPRGNYNGVVTYAQYDYVSYLGASYYWRSLTSGNDLPPSANWQLVSERGIQGLQGIQGDRGIQGLQGVQGIAGSPYNSRGTYNPAATYLRFDYVSFGGASYYWQNPIAGNASPPSSNWQLVSSPGVQGVQGTQGIAGSPYNSRGFYNITSTYALYDYVNHLGASYYWQNTISGNDFPPSSNWQLVASQGERGIQGSQGVQGIQGGIGIQGVAGSRYNPRGAYASVALYTAFDYVSLDGSSYYWQNPIAGNSLPPSSDWQLVSDRGVQGLQGVQGTQGDRGTQGVQGIAGSPYNPRSTYNGVVTYALFDYVSYLGASYYWRSAISGNDLPPSSNWQLVSDRGEVGTAGLTGSIGLTGATGVTGVAGSPYNPRGIYSGAASYNKYDNVNLDGNSYYWALEIAGNDLPPSTSWQLVTSRGPIGLTGTTGVTGTKGDTGLTGAQGVPGSPYNSRGTYSGGNTYNKYDYVSFNNASYFWASDTAGNSAPPSVNWQTVSIGVTGATGVVGLTGPIGIQGVAGSPYNSRGIYSGGAVYNTYDYVIYNNASYFWSKATSGNSLPPSIDWQTVAIGVTGATGTAGATGTTGATGATGAAGIDGKSFVARGTYSVVGTYNKFDLVIYQGSSYLWTTISGGNTIPPSTDWQLVASVGSQGIQGTQGTIGATGVQGSIGSSFNSRGTYNSSAVYIKYDYVDYLGSSYYWLSGTNGNNIPPSVSWQLVAIKGDPGSSGAVGSLSDGSKGDITVSSSGNTWLINNNSVELANIQEISTNRILGRSSVGQGAVEQLTIGSGLTLTGSILSSSGTVYSQPNEPIGVPAGTIWIDTDENVGTGWQVVSGDYTVLIGDKLVIDCTNPITLLLPANPVAGSEIQLTKYIGSAIVSIDTNSRNFNGSVPVNLRYVTASTVNNNDTLVYINNAIGWISLRKQTRGPINLVYVSDGDTNGLVYYIGTNGLTSAFNNPIASGALPAVMSTIEGGSITFTTDRLANEWYSNNVANQWIAFDWGSKAVTISRYTIRNRTNPDYYLRNWVLEGTNSISTFDIAGINAATWTNIDTRIADATLVSSSQYYTLIPNGTANGYRYIRFRQNGLTNNGFNNMCVGELEFYGSFF